MSRIFSRAERSFLMVVLPALRDNARARPGRLPTLGKPAFLLLLLAFSLTACGGGGGGAQSSGAPADYASREASPAPSSGEDGEAASAGAAASAASSSAQVEERSAAALPGLDGEKIVKTADLGLSTEDVREVASRAQDVASRFGGGVTSSRINGGDASVSADLVLSVPSGEFEAALDDLRGLGEVTTDTVGGEDVTEEFVDLQSRERNLLAAEESLLRLYGEARSVDDTLSIERELTDLRGQIETVQGRIQYLEDRTSASRIAVAIRTVEKSADARPAWEPVRAAATAWNASLGFLGGVASAVLSVVVFAWWTVPALVAAGVWWRRRPRRTGPASGP